MFTVLVFANLPWYGQGSEAPPPKLGPPKTLGPPRIEIAEVPPLKLHGHIKGNQVPSRETSHSLLGNSHLCSVFLYY